MQITLNQEEILVAVETYVRSQINIADNQDITIDFTAGRGPNGLTATLDIVPAKAKPVATRTAPKAAKPAPKEEPVAEEQEEAPAEEPAAEEEAKPAISTGEERTDPEETAAGEAPKKGNIFSTKPAAPESGNDAENTAEDAGADSAEADEKPQPKSIFSRAG